MDFKFRNIWLDVVIVLDTSEAMTQDDLDIVSIDWSWFALIDVYHMDLRKVS